MKKISETLVSADNSIRELLRVNSDAAAMSYIIRDETLSNLFYEILTNNRQELINWVLDSGFEDKYQRMEGLVSFKQKERLCVVSDATGNLKLKRGVLTLGTFPRKSIHALVKSFGLKESEPGYYLLVLFMMQGNRPDVLNQASIVKNY